MADLTWTDLDDMVEGDPLALRDTAWAEIHRLQRELVAVTHARDSWLAASGAQSEEIDRLGKVVRDLRAGVRALPEPMGTNPDGGDPYWTLPEGLEAGAYDTETVTASVAGVALNDTLHPDVDDLERIALTMLAAIHAHRALKETHCG